MFVTAYKPCQSAVLNFCTKRFMAECCQLVLCASKTAISPTSGAQPAVSVQAYQQRCAPVAKAHRRDSAIALSPMRSAQAAVSQQLLLRAHDIQGCPRCVPTSCAVHARLRHPHLNTAQGPATAATAPAWQRCQRRHCPSPPSRKQRRRTPRLRTAAASRLASMRQACCTMRVQIPRRLGSRLGQSLMLRRRTMSTPQGTSGNRELRQGLCRHRSWYCRRRNRGRVRAATARRACRARAASPASLQRSLRSSLLLRLSRIRMYWWMREAPAMV